MRRHSISVHPRLRAAVRTVMRTVMRTVALAGVLAQPVRVAAQQAAATDTATLRLDALYRAAQASSPRLSAARALARAAESRVPSSTRPPDPELQVGLMNRELPSLAPMDPLGMTTLQVMQMIPAAGKLAQAGQAARARAAAASDRADEVRWDLRASVAMAFYDLYRSDRSVAIATQTRRLLTDIAKTTQTMYAVGDGRQPDVLRANVEIARMTGDIVRMAAMRTGTASRLDGLLDRPPGTTSGRPVLPVLPDSVPALDSLQRWAEARRPMLRAGEQEVLAAAADERLARRELWPDVEVGVQYGRRGGTMGIERMGSLMVGASLPIFARRRQLAMRDEAAAMHAMARADLAQMRADTRARVGELHADLVRAVTLRRLYRTTILPQAEATVTSSLAAYRVGEINFMTLLDNQMSVNRYEQELLALEADEGTSLAELEMLTGRELFDVNVLAEPAKRGGE